MGRVRDELPVPGLAEIASLGVGRVNIIKMTDDAIRDCFRVIRRVLWRDFVIYDRYRWYYAEKRTYLIQDKWTDAVWCVSASNPMEALCVVLGKIEESAKQAKENN